MAESLRDRFADGLPLTAFGVIVGVSFLAQPAKFLTPELTLVQLVSVGRTVFAVSHAVQLVLLQALALFAWSLLGLFALALAVQQFVLMPALAARLQLMKQGGQTGPSSMHASYVALEVLKLASLLALHGSAPAARGRRRFDTAAAS